MENATIHVLYIYIWSLIVPSLHWILSTPSYNWLHPIESYQIIADWTIQFSSTPTSRLVRTPLLGTIHQHISINEPTLTQDWTEQSNIMMHQASFGMRHVHENIPEASNHQPVVTFKLSNFQPDGPATSGAWSHNHILILLIQPVATRA